MLTFPTKPFLIAEAGVNHNGDPERAIAMIDAAAEAGADAVKFQTFKAESLAAASAPLADYQKKGTSAGDQRAMLKALELSPKVHESLARRCKEKKIMFLSTPFDEESADLLERLGVEMFKIPSGEITNTALISHIARKKRPLLVSTGMSTLDEVAAAVVAVQGAGNDRLALLHCVSDYPAAPADANLKAMRTMADTFCVPVGFSDHTPGIDISVAAAALGADLIEKHFTLDKTLPGPDHAMSLDTAELRAWVVSVRNAAAALGDGVKVPRPSEEKIRRVARRSLVLTAALPKGTVLTAGHLCAKRPGTGIPPSELGDVLGKTLSRDLPADTVLERGMIG